MTEVELDDGSRDDVLDLVVIVLVIVAGVIARLLLADDPVWLSLAAFLATVGAIVGLARWRRWWDRQDAVREWALGQALAQEPAHAFLRIEVYEPAWYGANRKRLLALTDDALLAAHCRGVPVGRGVVERFPVTDVREVHTAPEGRNRRLSFQAGATSYQFHSDPDEIDRFAYRLTARGASAAD